MDGLLHHHFIVTSHALKALISLHHLTNVPPHHVQFPPGIKDTLMFPPGTVHEDLLKHTERLNTPAPFAELESLRDLRVPS